MVVIFHYHAIFHTTHRYSTVFHLLIVCFYFYNSFVSIFLFQKFPNLMNYLFAPLILCVEYEPAQLVL